MNVFQGQNILSFIKELPNDESCKAYLAKIKWSEGFICKDRCIMLFSFLDFNFYFLNLKFIFFFLIFIVYVSYESIFWFIFL